MTDRQSSPAETSPSATPAAGQVHVTTRHGRRFRCPVCEVLHLRRNDRRMRIHAPGLRTPPAEGQERCAGSLLEVVSAQEAKDDAAQAVRDQVAVEREATARAAEQEARAEAARVAAQREQAARAAAEERAAAERAFERNAAQREAERSAQAEKAGPAVRTGPRLGANARRRGPKMPDKVLPPMKPLPSPENTRPLSHRSMFRGADALPSSTTPAAPGGSVGDTRRARTEAKAARPRWVYRLYDAEGLLLYVGVSEHPTKRLRQASTPGQSWRSEVDHDRTTVVECTDQRMAAYTQAMAIRVEEPLHNVDRPDAEAIARMAYRARRARARTHDASPTKETSLAASELEGFSIFRDLLVENITLTAPVPVVDPSVDVQSLSARVAELEAENRRLRAVVSPMRVRLRDNAYRAATAESDLAHAKARAEVAVEQVRAAQFGEPYDHSCIHIHPEVPHRQWRTFHTVSLEQWVDRWMYAVRAWRHDHADRPSVLTALEWNSVAALHSLDAFDAEQGRDDALLDAMVIDPNLAWATSDRHMAIVEAQAALYPQSRSVALPHMNRRNLWDVVVVGCVQYGFTLHEAEAAWRAFFAFVEAATGQDLAFNPRGGTGWGVWPTRTQWNSWFLPALDGFLPEPPSQSTPEASPEASPAPEEVASAAVSVDDLIAYWGEHWFPRQRRRAGTVEAVRVQAWLEKVVAPFIGHLPYTALTPALLNRLHSDLLASCTDDDGSFTHRVQTLCLALRMLAVAANSGAPTPIAPDLLLAPGVLAPRTCGFSSPRVGDLDPFQARMARPYRRLTLTRSGHSA